jgi:prophage antirepressor-like protein
MNGLVPLHFETNDIRMILLDGEPWWVLNDVCAVLDIANPRNAARRLRDWQKGWQSMDTLGGRQDMVVVNEPGVYKLIMASRKEDAERFEHWLFSKVLPSIRKYGQYPPPVAAEVRGGYIAPTPSRIPATEGERLLEEIERWQTRNEGQDIHAANVISKNRLKALVLMRVFSGAHLTKDGLWLKLANQGIDIFYILHGRPWAEAYPVPTMQQPLRIASADIQRNPRSCGPPNRSLPGSAT